MPSKTRIKLILIILVTIAIGAFAGFLYWTLTDLPEIKTLENYRPSESSFIYSSDGKILAELYLERRNFIPHYNIPAHVKKAFIAIEDHRFYSHPGVDTLGVLRAIYRNIRALRIVEGGSTITQQLSKLLFLKPERNISRKVKEAIVATQIERRYTKDEILGMYLNQAYFGARAHGIGAAAWVYFGKHISELSIGESAMLAGLLRAPGIYSPFRNFEKSFIRRQIVLTRMRDLGFIDIEEYELANTAPLPIAPNYRKYNAPYFVEFLKRQLEVKYGDEIYTSGIKIYSTVNYEMQRAAEEAVLNGVNTIEERAGSGIQAALIAIDPKNGHIKAMVGGTDFWETQFNRATMALRQPGSAFKPFVYLSALESGMSETDKILDEPIFFPGEKPNTIWAPRNYNDEYHGYVSIKTALASSLNAATVRLGDNIGIANIINMAKKCGIKSHIYPYLSVVLGASEVTLLELTSAYGTFATGSVIEPLSYEKIFSRDDILLEDTFSFSERVLSPEIVDEIRGLLRAVIETGTAQKAKELNRAIYGKTGTTNDFTDSWFIGFDDRLVVGVWVGRDNHTPIGAKETGARASLPIWIEFMKNIP